MDFRAILEGNPELAASVWRLRVEPDTPCPVLSAKIKLTARCNLRCTMCSIWREPIVARTVSPRETSPGSRTDSPRHGQLDLAEVKEILAALKAQGLRKIHFSGGEVLLLDWLPDVIKFARSLELAVNLTTNGTLLDKAVARMLVAQRVHSVTISIDSADEKQHDAIRGVKGAWRDAWRGVDRLVERRRQKGRGPSVAINTVVMRDTIGALDGLYDLLREHGVDRWHLLAVDTFGIPDKERKKMMPAREQWDALASRWDAWRPLLARLPVEWSSERSGRRAEKGKYAGAFYENRICYAPWLGVFIDMYGRVYPCCMGKGKMRPYGNVRATPIEQLLAGRARRAACCTMAAGIPFDVCNYCDDFLEENRAIAHVCKET